MSWYSIDSLGIQKNPYQNSSFQFFTKKQKSVETTETKKKPKKNLNQVKKKEKTAASKPIQKKQAQTN